jgi:hypothetical protein
MIRPSFDAGETTPPEGSQDAGVDDEVSEGGPQAVRIVYEQHPDAAGSWSAESPDIPRWLAVSDSVQGIRELAGEGVEIFEAEVGHRLRVIEQGLPPFQPEFREPTEEEEDEERTNTG